MSAKKASDLLKDAQRLVNQERNIQNWFWIKHGIQTDADAIRAITLLAMMEREGITPEDVLKEIERNDNQLKQ